MQNFAITNATCQEDVLKVLPHVCPDNSIELEIFCVWNRDTWDVSQLVELEQWKKASQLEMTSIRVQTEIQNYAHFEFAKVNFENVTADDVIKVKENCLHSPSTTKHLKLYYHRFSDQKILKESFGEAHENTPNRSIGRKKILVLPAF